MEQGPYLRQEPTYRQIYNNGALRKRSLTDLRGINLIELEIHSIHFPHPIWRIHSQISSFFFLTKNSIANEYIFT